MGCPGARGNVSINIGQQRVYPSKYLFSPVSSRSRVSGLGAVARAAALIADGCIGVARAALLIIWELAQRVVPSILDRFAARLDSLVGGNVYYILDKNCT